MKKIFSLVILLLFSDGPFSQTHLPAEVTYKIDSLFSKSNKDNSPGYAVGIFQDTSLVFGKGYGNANLEYNIPITTETDFNLASLSKQFTAACLALLILDGKVSLEDDVKKYLSEFPHYSYQIKIKHLIYMTLEKVFMRNIILDLAVSLDGYIEGPNGEYDWCFVDRDYGFTDLLNSIDTIFYGRKSFELFGSSIPPANASEMENKIFRMMDEKKKYGFSRTLKSADGAVLIINNIKEEITKIKQEPGKDIYIFGGANLAASLLNLNLIDEFILAVHPIILGAGKPLFQNINERKNLKLNDSKIYSNGLVMLFYEPAK